MADFGCKGADTVDMFSIQVSEERCGRDVGGFCLFGWSSPLMGGRVSVSQGSEARLRVLSVTFFFKVGGWVDGLRGRGQGCRCKVLS